MGYNPFRWYTQGKYRKKPLKSNAPLLLKIQNGDFEKSPFYKEAEDNMKLYDKMYNEYIEKSNSKDDHMIKHEAHQYAKMKKIKARETFGKRFRRRINKIK